MGPHLAPWPKSVHLCSTGNVPPLEKSVETEERKHWKSFVSNELPALPALKNCRSIRTDVRCKMSFSEKSESFKSPVTFPGDKCGKSKIHLGVIRCQIHEAMVVNIPSARCDNHNCTFLKRLKQSLQINTAEIFFLTPSRPNDTPGISNHRQTQVHSWCCWILCWVLKTSMVYCGQKKLKWQCSELQLRQLAHLAADAHLKTISDTQMLVNTPVWPPFPVTCACNSV